MGTDHDGNKKWPGLKRPVGTLFSPRGQKRGTVTIGNQKGEGPVVENVSGATSSTENLTEADESPTTGKPNIFGRLRRQEQDVTLTPDGKAKRRPSGPMNLLRKAMFTQNRKEDSSLSAEASRDKRETPALGLDPLFDDDLTSSRQSSVKPPSCSDLSSSAAHSSRTDMSGLSHRPPRPGERVVSPILSTDSNPASKNAPSAKQTTKGGEGTNDTDSGHKAAARTPRPMQTGVRNTLVTSLLNGGGGMDASFHPTLSQKLQIGKEEIEKKMEARKKPPIDPLKLAPSITGQDRRAVGAKVGSNTASKSTSNAAKSTVTRRKSIGSDAVTRENAEKEAKEGNLESPRRSTTPTVLHDRSKVSSQSSRHRRPHHSREKPEEKRRHNSDGTTRSRGRSGPRHGYDQSPKTPGSQHSTKERKYVHHRTRHDESSSELPKISNLDDSPSRTRHGSTKSPSHDRHKDRRQASDKRHGRSQDVRNYASRREERRLEEEKKRSKSLDESMSRDKSIQLGHGDLIDHHDDPETDRSHSSGHHRKRDHSSPHSRESHRTRTEKSPTAIERTRSKSMDDSQSRSKSPHHLSRNSSINSQNHSHSSGHRDQRGDSSPHNTESHRKRTEKSPATEERKRSNSMDDSQSRSKSPHHQSRRSSYESQHRNHSSGHRSHRGESSPHSRESHRKRTEKSPATENIRRSASMDDSQNRSQSTHQQSRRPSYDSRHRNHNKEHESRPSRSRSREASAHRNDLQSPNLSTRKRSLSLDESRSNSRRSHHGAERDSLTAEQEDKVTSMNELWNELTKYGPPHLRKQENERSQRVVSKAEKQRRDELGSSNRRTAATRSSHSPGRLSTHHDDDGTVNSGGTMSRRQTRRERKERGDDASYSRASRPSTSPSRRSSSSSHHRQVPPTPSGRSERSGTRSTSREKWEKLLHRDDIKTGNSSPADPPCPAALSTDDAEGKALSSPRSLSTDRSNGTTSTTPRTAFNESQGDTSTPLRADMDTPVQNETSSDSPPTNAHGSTSSIPPIMPDSLGESYQTIPRSALLTPDHYRAVNKMADRVFHSPLGDPPGMHSPTQRQGNRRTKLLASSSSSTTTSTAQEGKLPAGEQTGHVITTTYQDDDVLVSPNSRTAKLKNHLRQLEQLHGSLNSSHRSHSEALDSGGTSRNIRRQRSNEESGGGVTSSSRPKPLPTNHHGTNNCTSGSRENHRNESADHSRRNRQLIPRADNSPGHGSSQTLNTRATTTTTRDLGRFLKSPKPEKDDETAKRKLGTRTTTSLDSVPVSESTTES